MAEIKKITDKTRAKIGVEGYYNIDKAKITASSDKARELARKKDPDIIYDDTYGLIALDQDSIDAFLELNQLEPLGDKPSGVSASASAGSGSSGAGGSGSRTSSVAKKPTSVKSQISSKASSPDLMKKVRAKLEELPAGKFLNLSTLRPVNPGKKELIYNSNKRLAAQQQDAQLLNSVATELGGSPSGGMGQVELEADAPIVEPPEPISQRVTSELKLGRRTYGTPAALAASASASASVIPASASVISVDEVPVVIRPKQSGLVINDIIAKKQPLRTAFSLAKPV